jgi:hypothetical protein
MTPSIILVKASKTTYQAIPCINGPAIIVQAARKSGPALAELVSHGIVAIAEVFVERGLLQDREDIKWYMALAGRVRKTQKHMKPCLTDDS